MQDQATTVANPLAAVVEQQRFLQFLVMQAVIVSGNAFSNEGTHA